jgi:hypothetical protein
MRVGHAERRMQAKDELPIATRVRFALFREQLVLIAVHEFVDRFDPPIFGIKINQAQEGIGIGSALAEFDRSAEACDEVRRAGGCLDYRQGGAEYSRSLVAFLWLLCW